MKLQHENLPVVSCPFSFIHRNLMREVCNMFSFSTVEEFSELRETVRQKLNQLLVTGVEPLFVAVNEAVNNAIFHGNKQDKAKKVYLAITSSPGEVRIIVRDEGGGFSKMANAQPDELRESGRGLEIIGLCVDQYYYNAQPSEIVLIKKVAVSPLESKRRVVV
ncbi:Anti-sigma F factor [Sporomusa aerivorans]